MKTLNKILFYTSLLVSLKVQSQLDTLKYLKQFEANKTQYINQPFSKLLNDMNELQPRSLYTQSRGCNYDTQFYFTDIKEGFHSRFKINILWQNSVLYKKEHILNVNEIYSLRDVESLYKKYIIKNIEFNYQGDFYIMHRATKFIQDDDPFIHLNTYFEDYKKYLIDKPFYDFACWVRPMRIRSLKNIYNSSKAVALKTEFILINPDNKKKKVKIIVEWDSPIQTSQIREYKKKNSNRFNNDERSFYVDKLVKDISYSAR
ncbi:hypothetical protein [Chryseobacterium echinoideorum]|uniref:hypothetical protein n=1 Tax=Chryseobacterium echinoideorum TaxID=1549648 RepID=UPI0011850272|nr:hypothetical protein [Chryseobacterium echinoideorum]